MSSFRKSAAVAVAVAVAAAAGSASAQQLPTPVPSFTTAQYLNLRTGPGTGNPVVTSMPLHSQVWVYYCLPQPFWCYLSYGPHIGWASASYLVSYPGTAQPPIYQVPQPYPYPTPPAPPQPPGYWTYPGPQDNIQLIPMG